MIRPEFLESLGFTTRFPDHRIIVYFAKDRESYLSVEGNHMILYRFFGKDEPKETFRGFISSDEQLQEILNTY
jgi:hypothetical protein